MGFPRVIDFSFLVSAASIIFFHVSAEVNVNPVMYMRHCITPLNTFFNYAEKIVFKSNAIVITAKNECNECNNLVIK